MLGVLVPIILLTPSQVLSQPTDEPIASSFELERNQIVLPVWIDGKGPFYVLLDTAGSPSAVDLATALDLGFPVDTTLSARHRVQAVSEFESSPPSCRRSRSAAWRLVISTRSLSTFHGSRRGWDARFRASWDTGCLRGNCPDRLPRQDRAFSCSATGDAGVAGEHSACTV